MRPGKLFYDLHLYELLESLIPDFVPAFAFFNLMPAELAGRYGVIDKFDR
jgi:hypothetical protein